MTASSEGLRRVISLSKIFVRTLSGIESGCPLRKAKGAIVQPITVHFSINDRNVGGRQQRGGLRNEAAARQSSDRDLDMEGADGKPESGPACLSGILTYPNKSSILIHTYPYLSILILYDPIPSATCLCIGFVAQIHVDKSR